MRRWLKRLVAVLPVALAVVVVIMLVRSRGGPVPSDASEVARALRVIVAPRVALVPKAVGYGVAEPGRIWQAGAEVGGTILSVHPQLSGGALMEEGTVLVEIDPAGYELSMARLRATIAETRARLRELAADKENLEASLAIEKRSLGFAQKSLERVRDLRRQNVVPADEADREERNALQQEQAVRQIENALAQLPARREAVEAALAVHEANLALAERELGRTVIRAPFNCRLGEVKLERGQVVTPGQVLFEALGTDSVEVEARFRPEQMRDLLPPEKRRQFQPGMDMERLRRLFNVTATVRLRSGDWEAVWPARFDRIRESVDPRTRAIGVVAIIDKPYEQVIPGVRPALARGMFCEMELLAPPRPDTVVLPREAVTAGRVCLVDNSGRLRTQQVEVNFAQDDLVAIQSGLDGGESVIVSDPAPAMEGMKVEPVPDDDLRVRLIRQATGAGEGHP